MKYFWQGAGIGAVAILSVVGLFSIVFQILIPLAKGFCQ